MLLTGNSMFSKFPPEILCSPQWPTIFHFGAETTKEAILAFVRHEAVVGYHTSTSIEISVYLIFSKTHTIRPTIKVCVRGGDYLRKCLFNPFFVSVHTNIFLKYERFVNFAIDDICKRCETTSRILTYCCFHECELCRPRAG